MLISYHRAGRLSLFSALAAIAAAVVLAGVMAVALVIISAAACGVWLVRALGRPGRAIRPVPAGPDIIEGVVVDSSDADGD